MPPSVKHFLVAKVFFGPSTGRLIRMLGPKRNLRGLAFDLGSRNLAVAEVANLYFNRRERAELDFVKRHVIASDITNIIELGTSIGFIASNIVYTKRVRYVGIEGSPRLAHDARINIHNNNRTNSTFLIDNFCIDYSGREYVEFDQENDSLVGRVRSGGANSVSVKAVRLQDVLAAHPMKDFALIADVEGAEADVLFKDEQSLENCRLIVAELEDTAEYTLDDQVRRAREIGFELKERFRNVFAFGR